MYSQMPLTMQAARQALLRSEPLSLLMRETYTLRPLAPLFLSSITPLGQAFTHAPHEVHLSSSTSGRPVLTLILIASNLQALSQSPSPRQPNLQPVSPE